MKSMMNKKTLFLYVFFSTLILFAKEKTREKINYAVNMQDGGLILKEENILSKTYRSRSLDLGYFGQGWCSDFESEIIFQGRGVIRLVNCQSSRPTLFKVNETASAYVSLDNSSDRIVIKLGHYERQIQSEWIAKYNFKGKLISYRKNKNIFKIVSNTRALPVRISSGSEAYTLTWHPVLNLIEKVSAGEKTQILTYSGFNLIKVQTGKDILTYQYDDLDNMISRTGLKIEYDKVLDQVLKIEGECVETYAYLKKSMKRNISTMNRSCKSLSTKTEFVFDYKDDLRKPAHITVNKLPTLDRISSNQGSPE